MSTIIPIQVYNNIGFECCAQDTQCCYTRNCTNHSSAGDFRMDHGMQPLITMVDVQNKVLICQTKDSAQRDLPHDSEIVPLVCVGFGKVLTLDEVNTSQLSLDL